jgi:hypothetical protein
VTTIDDITKHLRTDLPVTSINYTRIEARVPQVFEVCYFFEIIHVTKYKGWRGFLSEIKDSYMGSQKDTFWNYPIKNVDHGVELCKKFCNSLGIEFKPEDERKLRAGKTSGTYTIEDNLQLVVVERPIYKS